ncbi:hypothetical protein [Gordonia polyisoprenivorans]|uniref:hypothetical protein n=1 Tax=Gordonia polyisoprenivorans TaxID=84595 RepID=UPI0020124C6D|nr:hypothetical protein [Gordonia polyisoprenivorans]
MGRGIRRCVDAAAVEYGHPVDADDEGEFVSRGVVRSARDGAHDLMHPGGEHLHLDVPVGGDGSVEVGLHRWAGEVGDETCFHEFLL